MVPLLPQEMVHSTCNHYPFCIHVRSVSLRTCCCPDEDAPLISSAGSAPRSLQDCRSSGTIRFRGTRANIAIAYRLDAVKALVLQARDFKTCSRSTLLVEQTLQSPLCYDLECFLLTKLYCCLQFVAPAVKSSENRSQQDPHAGPAGRPCPFWQLTHVQSTRALLQAEREEVSQTVSVTLLGRTLTREAASLHPVGKYLDCLRLGDVWRWHRAKIRGSVLDMAEDALDAKERLWNPQDWCWDPYNMLALASDREGIAPAGKAVFGGLPYAVQPQLGPAASLLLDDVNRSGCRGKGPAVCQVDGCSAELAGLKEYHQRYISCVLHIIGLSEPRLTCQLDTLYMRVIWVYTADICMQLTNRGAACPDHSFVVQVQNMRVPLEGETILSGLPVDLQKLLQKQQFSGAASVGAWGGPQTGNYFKSSPG